MRLVCLLTLAVAAASAEFTRAAEPEPQEAIRRVVNAAGGEQKLLRLFRMKERLSIGSDAKAAGKERISVLDPPQHWWVGKTERVGEEKEPAIFLVWAWTLRAIVDDKSKIEVIPDIIEDEKPAFGLRVSGTIDPPMDLYFDKGEDRLVRIDWRRDIHRFSEWKEYDGVKYPAKCVGYKTATGKPWYFTEIVDLERLKELPPELKP